MSLIHWWPLNGDLKDKVGGKTLSSTGWTSVSDGKIGNCYNANIGATATVTLTLPDTLTFAYWVKNNDLTYPKSPCPIKFSNGNCYTAGASNKGLDMCHGGFYDLTINDGVSFNRSVYKYTSTEHVNSWHHVVSVVDYKKKMATLYINGKEEAEGTFSGMGSFAGTYVLTIGQMYGWKLDGFINDLRIYDHALSQAEIKKLSKALVVHYTFNDTLAEPTTNIITGIKSAHGKSSLYGNGVKIDWSAGGVDSYFLFNYSQAIKENSVYTLSFDCEGLKSGEVATFAVSNLGSAYTVALKNGRNSLTFTAGSDLMNDINTYNRLFFDDKTRTEGAVFYLTNFQLEEKDHVTLYTPSSRESVICNETGFIQPTYNANIKLAQDSSSGIFSLSCTGNTIINTPITGDITSGATVSCWIKTPTYPSADAIVFADYNSKLAFGFYNTQDAIISCGGYSVPYISNIKKNWLSTEWNHVIVTRNSSGEISCYLNGSELPTTSSSNNWTSTSGYSTIGGRYNGDFTTYCTCLIDDFRLYHSCLSEEEILELYQTKVYFTCAGDIQTHEFVENAGNFLAKKDYTINADVFQETLMSGYTPVNYICSTNGTEYIDTGYYWQSEKATIIADINLRTHGSNQSIFGAEEYTAASGSARRFSHILYGSGGNFSNYIGTGSVGTTKIPLSRRCIIKYTSTGVGNAFSTEVIPQDGDLTGTQGYSGTYSGSIQAKAGAYLTGTTTSNVGHIFIFANHNSNRGTTTAATQTVSNMELYRFTMWDNGIRVRDFVPCERNSDGRRGLYDLVSGGFYTTQTGVFSGSTESPTNNQIKFYKDKTVEVRQLVEL